MRASTPRGSEVSVVMIHPVTNNPLVGTNLTVVKNELSRSQDFSRSTPQESKPLNRLLDELRLSLKEQEVDSRVEVSFDKDINQVIIRVVDKETGDLQRQFPPEDILEIKRFLSEHSGLFVEEEA